MNRFFLALLVLALGGCEATRNLSPFVHEPLTEAVPTQLPDGQALVIVGMSTMLNGLMFGAAEYSAGGWIKIDSQTRERRDNDALEWTRGTGIAAPASVRGGRGYDIYMMPAGTYALAWLQRYNHFYFPVEFEQFHGMSTAASGGLILLRSFSPNARARPNAPTFTVNPGEVLYVGDLYLSFVGNKDVRWSIKRSDDDMMKFLASKGVATSPSIRTLQRADGGPVTDGDGVPAVDMTGMTR
jgi:hypothetical protein